MTRKPKIRWGALVGFVTTIAGVATDPHVVAALHAVWPASAALSPVLVLVGAVIAAKTKPVVRAEHERTP